LEAAINADACFFDLSLSQAAAHFYPTGLGNQGWCLLLCTNYDLPLFSWRTIDPGGIILTPANPGSLAISRHFSPPRPFFFGLFQSNNYKRCRSMVLKTTKQAPSLKV